MKYALGDTERGGIALLGRCDAHTECGGSGSGLYIAQRVSNIEIVPQFILAQEFTKKNIL
jgi:hypothetical protein